MNPEQIREAVEQGHHIVTATERLARDLRRRYIEAASAQGPGVWQRPPIVSLRRFAEGLDATGLPGQSTLHPIEATLYYERAVGESTPGQALLQPGLAASLARRGDALASRFRIDTSDSSFDGNPDSEAWRAWYRAAREQMNADDVAPDTAPMERLISDAQALALAPGVIETVGFDQPEPLDKALFDALEEAGVAIHHHATGDAYPTASTRECRRPASHRDERAAAAQQIATWLAPFAGEPQNAPSIAVVLADLQRDGVAMEQALTEALAPQLQHPGYAEGARPWRFVTGTPLTREPVVADALRWLQLSRHGNRPEAVTTVLLSPSLGAIAGERAARARIDTRLRNGHGAGIDLAHIARHAEPLASDLARRMVALDRALSRYNDPAAPSIWSRRFHRRLQLAGWPAGGARDSRGRQAFDAFGECLALLARLDRVRATMDHDEAWDRLWSIVEGHAFLPTTDHAAPVEIMALDGISGHRYDHAIVLDLHAERLPAKPDPHPLLPTVLQQLTGMPQASAANRLEQAEHRVEQLRHLAEHVLLMCAGVNDNGQPLTPTPLFEGWGVIEEAEGGDSERIPPLMCPIEHIPAMDEQECRQIRGGTRLVADTAIAPFYGFARHRLGIEALESPATGIDAALQGQFAHRAVQQLAQYVDSSDRLAAMDTSQRHEAASAAAEVTLQSPEFAAIAEQAPMLCRLERQRLVDLLLDWLQVEATRTLAWRIVATEREAVVVVAGIEIRVKIDRIDIVETEDGPRAFLIDYKTGELPSNGWHTEALTEPQLPLYPLARIDWGAPFGGIAFAELRSARARYAGWTTFGPIAGEKRGYAPIQAPDDLLAAWSSAAQSIVEQLKAGEAGITPATLRRHGRRYGDLEVFVETPDGVA